MTVRTLAQSIPAKIRAGIYVVLGVLIPLEAIWDVIPSPLEGKLLASLGALGFGMAALNVSPPVADDRPPEFP